MCKKFFHPSNPQNLERVFIAKQRLEQKEKEEAEKHAEYEKEQERWNSKNILSKVEDRDKMQLSFMYEPPLGMRKEEEKEVKVGKDKKEGEVSLKSKSPLKHEHSGVMPHLAPN